MNATSTMNDESVVRSLKRPRKYDWVLVKGFSLSYHNKETALFAVDPYYGNLI